MARQILIIGGGISGLSVLHFLKKKYASRPDVQIILVEKNNDVGGTIRTIREDGFMFETGPNGFLPSSVDLLALAEELGLTDALEPTSPNAQNRYILFDGQLCRLPSDPFSFFSFRPMSLVDKLRIFFEFFVAKGNSEDESVYEFGRRRLGENFSKIFLDPMVTGVYGGDVRKISLKSAFPKVYRLEQNYGSLIKGAVCLFRERRKNKAASGTRYKTPLVSFKNGMSQLIETLRSKYADFIKVNCEVTSLALEDGQFKVVIDEKAYFAQEVFLCAPAHKAEALLKGINESLSGELAKIPYVSIVVVGLAYPASAFKKMPSGFGYLIPSSQKRQVLGVIFSGCVFPGRAKKDAVLFQVMLGGAHHPEISDESTGELIESARREISERFSVDTQPVREFFSFWPKAIPQYHIGHARIVENIEEELTKTRGLFLAANYLKGVSVNDCVAWAKRASEKSNL